MFRAFLTFAVTLAVSVLVGTVAVLTGFLRAPRRIFEFAYRFWASGILAAAGVRLIVQGAEHLRADQNYFFVGNHQSAMDIPVLIAATGGRVRFMAKRSLFYVPMLGWAMWFQDFVVIDRANARKAKASIDKMLERLAARPVSMLVFPEGTRSQDGTIAPFKHGALKVCQRANLPVVPVAIEGTLHVHRSREFKIRPGRVHVSFAEPIPAEELAALSVGELADCVRDRVVEMQQAAGSTPRTPAQAVVAGTRGRS